MRRRTFVFSAGSIFAGLTAAIGSGAFGTAEAERDFGVSTAGDGAGLIELTALDDRYATDTTFGQLGLSFTGGPTMGGNGLNPATRFYFTEIFQIQNTSSTELRVGIEIDGLDELEEITMTAHGEEADMIEDGTSLLVDDYNDVDDLPQVGELGAVNVDITIETPPASEFLGEMDGNFRIHVGTEDTRENLSDVL
ncbi:hypothetical protein K0C01_12185 [Salinarchaeum sp. IM2453]|uniref:hypothetical protein n=1 Tax=Salinarchaeum sp. IM2453 TaxID=2862870 RepID=UPI001C828C6B|nr:hypothetical protein [Salinarchaeum sp. IM2453]QZA88522.1 hypothetical protein K0C01_12185 [Salinarchaeum sp. IM2453]